MKRDIFIGGAWPYANNSLHIGHLAALLPADIIARYFRSIGDNVVYVSGTDCHGTPITIRAKDTNMSPAEIVSIYHKEFSKNFADLDFSYDLYTATTTEDHKNKVKAYYKKMMKNGYIYEGEEDQEYCESCNQFLSDREIIGICPHCGGEAKGDQCDKCLVQLTPAELIDKKCKSCGKMPVVRKNKHLYFKLSAFQKDIEELLKRNGGNWRKASSSETKKYLDMGLIDRATTRQLNWGVEVPVEGYEDKKIYVWIEAVLGYLTAGSKVIEEKGYNFSEYMKDRDNLITYFVHGKDNIVFHTIIYPALLLSIDKTMQLPKFIISSEYINMNNEKMSKSKGNLITVNELTSRYNKDTLRYYMISNNPEKRDVNFSEQDIIQTHNKFLVGVLGNFVNRNLAFIQKKFDGQIKQGKIDENIKKSTVNTFKVVGHLIEVGELRSALENIMEYVTLGNKYYDEQKPWVQVKENIEQFNNITYTCIYMIANIANLIAPFLPSTSDKIKGMLNLPESKWEVCNIAGEMKVLNADILFERLDDEVLEKSE